MSIVAWNILTNNILKVLEGGVRRNQKNRRTQSDPHCTMVEGRVKAMSQTLRQLSKPDAWPGQDFVYVFSPKQICNVLHVCVY